MPTIEISKVPQEQQEAFTKWYTEQWKNGRTRKGYKMVVDTQSLSVNYVDDEPVIEYFADTRISSDHTISFGEKIVKELESAGIIFDRQSICEDMTSPMPNSPGIRRAAVTSSSDWKVAPPGEML